MNVLTLNARYGQLMGSITLNDAPLSRDQFRKHCFYVQQYDKNWMHLTVNEVLTFAHQLSSATGNTTHDITSAAVNDAITSMGLSDAQHTYCSNLSGGEQRRMSLAVALLNKPSIFFLDEITSGLDSAASDNICEVLRKVAAEKNLIVVCTIHQPSIKVFERFDQIILLSEGRLAYAGDRTDAESYFSSLGYPLPPRSNPAEHYLELLNSNFGARESSELICRNWESTQDSKQGDHCIDDKVHEDLEAARSETLGNSCSDTTLNIRSKDQARSTILFNLRTMFRRHFMLIWRNVSMANQ